MIEALTLPLLAVVAGFVSFSSPCCLPLIPGYLSYVSALPVAELGQADARRVTLRAAVLFVGGFSTVFTLLGAGATLVGSAFLRNQDVVVRWFGVFIIACGMTHFVAVLTLWTPVYWLAGDVKVITAMASVGTAVALRL